MEAEAAFVIALTSEVVVDADRDCGLSEVLFFLGLLGLTLDLWLPLSRT